jgi:two-component system, LytTR family, sensor kinase
MDQRLVLITLLIKLGVAAAVASALVRSKDFKDVLFTEERSLAQKLFLVFFAGTPFALGVFVRGYVHNFLAADLSFEAAMLIGVIGGRLSGALAGAFVSLPCLLFGQWLNLPFNVLSGFVAGFLRDLAADYELIWTFTPFVDLSVYRWFRRNFRRPRLDWQTAFFLIIIMLGLLNMEMGRELPARFFALFSSQWAIKLAILTTNVMGIAIPLKIFNNARIERKLEEQERALLQARMTALQSQINPHFLFNTLNSISSLVRRDPDTARELIVKLASILRRLVGKTDAFVPLRDEVSFIDDYLDIEVVRFGRDKLRVVKELEPESLEVLVPSMLLQPLVENAIKHGLSPKIGGGSIHLRSRVEGATLIIEVEDDGVGQGGGSHTETPSSTGGHGIGMANVTERLKVLFGPSAFLRMESRAGLGTMIQLHVPVLHPVEGVTADLHYGEATVRRPVSN